jgi:hypothetical protein
MVNFKQWLLYAQRKSLQCPIHRRLGGLQSQSGLSGDEEIHLSVPRIEPLTVQATDQ